MAPLADVELATLSTLKVKEDSLTHGSSHSMREPQPRRPRPGAARLRRFIDSFRRDRDSSFFPTHPLSQFNSVGVPARGPPFYDLHLAAVESANTGLARKLKGRHLQMIAIGGSIGTGLFVASGVSLSAGGPASLLIAFTIVGVMLYCTCQALGELSVIFPIAGSFSSWATRFLDPSWGFAMGWKLETPHPPFPSLSSSLRELTPIICSYALQWLTVLPLEIIAAAMTIHYWNRDLPSAIFVAIFLATIMLINLFGVKGYGEAEFTFSIIKVIAVIGFM